MNKRIAITGLGVIAANGQTKEMFWDALAESRSGIKPISLFDSSPYHVHFAAEATDFDPTEHFSARERINLDRATALLLVSAQQALADAHLSIDEENTYDWGVSVGTTFGSLESLSGFDKESVVKGPRLVNPSHFPNTVANLPASQISITHKIKGLNATISTGMSAGLDAIDYAIKQMCLYDKRIMISAAVEEMCEQSFMGLHCLRCLSGLNGQEPVSRPFDQRGDGVIFGEASGALILEAWHEADQRGAKIYAEIISIASNFDPTRFNRYNRDGRGMADCMRLALHRAKLQPHDIDLIIANANSAPDADASEAQAIYDVFADHVPVTSIKSLVGETYSCAGVLAVMAAIGVFRDGRVPFLSETEQPLLDPPLDFLLKKQVRSDIKTVLINAFGPNGANSTLILKRGYEF